LSHLLAPQAIGAAHLRGKPLFALIGGDGTEETKELVYAKHHYAVYKVTMKTVEATQHRRDSSLSSLESTGSWSLGSTDSMPRRGRISTSDSLTILASSSPEISALCKRPFAALLPFPFPSCGRSKSVQSSPATKGPHRSRAPLEELSEITVSLNSIRLYPTPLDESNKENIHPKTQPSLHRRVSYDMLPSPSEIHTTSTKRRPRHRRNTHILMFNH
jgi:hypothetical protein